MLAAGMGKMSLAVGVALAVLPLRQLISLRLGFEAQSKSEDRPLASDVRPQLTGLILTIPEAPVRYDSASGSK